MAAVLREAVQRPFSGVSYSIGRQTMGATPEATLGLFNQFGVAPRLLGRAPRVDTTTTAVLKMNGGQPILDADFYRLLGFDEHFAVDISDFEGAEIIVDLNHPLDPKLESTCDLLVDGSTLDNIFNPTQGLQNLARMLKPGGRCFLMNMSNASLEFEGIPYTIFNPLWFYDYFAANGFASCEVYVIVHQADGTVAYRLDHKSARRVHGPGHIAPVTSGHPLGVLVFAEKGQDSTWDKYPIQHSYRQEEDWKRFEEAVRTFEANARPPLYVSGVQGDAPEVPTGWYKILPDGSTTEPRHLWGGPFIPTGRGLPARVTGPQLSARRPPGEFRGRLEEEILLGPRTLGIELDEHCAWPGSGWAVEVGDTGAAWRRFANGRSAAIDLRLDPDRDYLLVLDITRAASVEILDAVRLRLNGADLPRVDSGWLPEGGAHLQWKLTSEPLLQVLGQIRLHLGLANGVDDPRLSFSKLRVIPILPPPLPVATPMSFRRLVAGGARRLRRMISANRAPAASPRPQG